MEITEWIKISYLYQMMVAGEDTPESYLKHGVDWILQKISFSNRIVDNWNSLSDNCVSYSTLNNFKSHMRLHWDWRPDSIV